MEGSADDAFNINRLQDTVFFNKSQREKDVQTEVQRLMTEFDLTGNGVIGP